MLFPFVIRAPNNPRAALKPVGNILFVTTSQSTLFKKVKFRKHSLCDN